MLDLDSSTTKFLWKRNPNNAVPKSFGSAMRVNKLETLLGDQTSIQFLGRYSIL